MKTSFEVIALFFLLLLSYVPAAAQSSDYLPNTLMIKYEDEQSGTADRAKGVHIDDPALQANLFLQQMGARESKPLWTEEKRDRLRNSPRIKTAVGTDPAENLKNIFEVTFSENIDPLLLAAKLRNMPGVEYAEPKYIRYTQEVPDDRIQNDFLEYHNFYDAWDETTGSSDVVVAIVDGGVSYNHPDLRHKLWINQDEIPDNLHSEVDENDDDTVTSTEILDYLEENDGDYDDNDEINLSDALHPDSPFTDGSDTDGNGYEDDLYGWDFWASGNNSDTFEDDNDPDEDGSDHGTHVAGIAAAHTNNDMGIAGAGYDINYMPVKAGGTPGNERVIGFGFEGIEYAAENGADIINCSWGGEGFSETELDIIEYATSLGSLVVAAAGNEAVDGITYPAGYIPVLGVGSVETDGSKAAYSNYGYNLDVLAAGSSIQSTVSGGQFGTSSGTSMSTPIVAGLAGLLKTLQPDWSPERISANIRATAVSVDNRNNRRAHKLGTGRVDAAAAVNAAVEGDLPGIVITDYEFSDTNGEKLGIEEDGLITLRLQNTGASTDNLTMDIQLLNEEGITLNQPQQNVSSLPEGEETELTIPVRIEEGFNLIETPALRINFTDNNVDYENFRVVTYDDILYEIIAENNILTSVASDGTVGFTDPLSGSGGVGFVPREPDNGGFEEGDNLLFEGGLIVEADGEIYDAVRNDSGTRSRDFLPMDVFELVEPTRSDLEGTTQFSFGDEENPKAIIDLTAYAFNDPSLSNVLYLQYEVQNPSEFNEIENLYLGIFNDWDIGFSPDENGATYVSRDSVLYLYDENEESSQPDVAVAHLGPVSSAFAIDNAATGNADSLNFGIYDDFTDTEKSIALKAGTERTEISNTDVSAVTASGPFTLSPLASATVGFLYAFGEDEEELLDQIANARSEVPFQVSETGTIVSNVVPETTELFQNYPNPFDQTTQLRVDLSEETEVTLDVYDILGRKVAEIADERLEARTHIFSFNGQNLSSGMYLVRLQTDQEMQTIKMLLVK